MKNKEKYAKEIFEIACSGKEIAVNKISGKVTVCTEIDCNNCLFSEICSPNAIKEWAESEYIEPVKISKRDRAFLEYINEEFKWITRDENKLLFAWSCEPRKSLSENEWVLMSCMALRLNEFSIDFPMVKWEDPEPWLIEDLKKLEVCEEYEID